MGDELQEKWASRANKKKKEFDGNTKDPSIVLHLPETKTRISLPAFHGVALHRQGHRGNTGPRLTYFPPDCPAAVHVRVHRVHTHNCMPRTRFCIHGTEPRVPNCGVILGRD